MHRNTRILFLAFLLSLVLLLSSCSQQSLPNVPTANPTESESTIITEKDILTAQEEIAITLSEEEIPFNETIALEQAIDDINDFDEFSETAQMESFATTLSTQAIPEGAEGLACFIEYNPSKTRAWRLIQQNFETGKRTVVYTHPKEIESVACSNDGNSIVFALEIDTDYELYVLTVNPRSLQRLTRNIVDDTNVTISADGKTIAWQSVNGNNTVITVRSYGFFGEYTTRILKNNAHSLLQPSLSANGQYIALVRLLKAGKHTGKYQVLRYSLVDKKYTSVLLSANQLENPSISDDSNKVSFVQKQATRDIFRVRNLTTKKFTTIFAYANGIEHPMISADGEWGLFTLNTSTNRSIAYLRHIAGRKNYSLFGASHPRKFFGASSSNLSVANQLLPPSAPILPPNAPSNLVMTIQDDEIHLGWTDNSNDEQSFRIYYKKDGGSFSQIASVNANQQLATVPYEAEVGQHTLVIRAFKTGVNELLSEASNEVSYDISPPPPTPTFATLPTTGIWLIKNKNSDMCVDITNGSTANYANVQQYVCDGTPAQNFRFEQVGSSYYITNVNSDKSLVVPNSSTTNEANIVQWTKDEGSNRKWKVTKTGEYYTFVVDHSSKCLDVQNASTLSGANIQQYVCDDTDAQKFILQEVQQAVTPNITSITGVKLGSTTLSINGSNFKSGAKVYLQYENSNTTYGPHTATYSSSSKLTLNTNLGTTQSYWNFWVKNPDGTESTKIRLHTNGGSTTPTSTKPNITNIDNVKLGWTTLSISGSNFKSGAKVYLQYENSNTTYGPLTAAYSSSSKLTLYTNLGTTNSYWNFWVKNPDGSESTKIRAHTNGASTTTPTTKPNITNITGLKLGSTTLSISGSNFKSGAKVYLQYENSSTTYGPHTATYSNSAQLTLNTNLGTTHSYWTFWVKNPDGTESNKIRLHTNGGGSTPPITSSEPNITSIYNVQLGSTTLDIRGSNFKSGAQVYLKYENSNTTYGPRASTYSSSGKLTLPTNLGTTHSYWTFWVKNPDGTESNKIRFHTNGSSTTTPTTNPSGSIIGDDYPYKNGNMSFADAWNFYIRQCVSFTAWRVRQKGIDFHNYYNGVHWGNAHNWDNAARSLGIPVNNTPQSGAIAVFEAGVSGAHWQYGHVAYVAQVHGNGNITIEEYNWIEGKYGTRIISATSVSSYIHF